MDKGDLWISFVLEVGVCGTETEKRQSWALAEVFWDGEDVAEGSKHLWGDGEDSYFPGSVVLCFPQVLAPPRLPNTGVGRKVGRV